MKFLQPECLWWSPLALVLLAPGVTALWSRRRALIRFYGSASVRPWSPSISRVRAVARLVLVISAVLALLVALARPAYNPQPTPVQRSGRDVVFLVDVSRSMLAQDLRPSRLERAKLAVADALEAARGERVGIIAFAGSSVVKCPLTTDFAFARLALDGLSTDSVSRGGTAIGDGIRSALALLTANDPKDADPKTSGRYRDIIILTDGEDHQTDPLSAAKAAAEANIRVITVGLGSDLQGSTIPAPGAQRVLEYQGEAVSSRMNPDALRQVAEATPGGRFYNVGTGSIELDAVYRQLMRNADRRAMDVAPAMRYTEAFQWPLGLALLLLLAEPLVSDISRWRARA